jgi:peptide/nickel transport system ATP-binding protein
VSALDVSVQAQILGLLDDLQQRLRLSLIFITHDLRVAARIAHRVAVMHRGRVVEQGDVWQVFEHPQHDYTRALLAAAPGRGFAFGGDDIASGER